MDPVQDKNSNFPNTNNPPANQDWPGFLNPSPMAKPAPSTPINNNANLNDHQTPLNANQVPDLPTPPDLPPTNNQDQQQDHLIPKSQEPKQSNLKKNLLVAVLAGVFVSGSILASGVFLRPLFTANSPNQYSQEPIKLTEEQKKQRLEEIKNFSPVNPTQAEIVSQSDGQVTFSWSGEQVKEEGVKVTGYMVYFGEKKILDAFNKNYKSQKENTFTATNLEKGKTYYLFVRVMTDNKQLSRALGFDIAKDGVPVRPIFTYQHE